MKRKLTSILLMSALLVGGASTFVSCKDYDGDQAAVQNANLAKLQEVVTANKLALEAAIGGKQDKLSDAILADLAKLNETIAKANSAEEWVKANTDLNKLTANVTALATLAQDQETLTKLAAMTETWGKDLQNVVVKDDLADYLTKEELQQAWPSIEALFEKKADMAADVENYIDSITAANAENYTSYADLVAAFDTIPAHIKEIDAQLAKLLAWNENIQYTLDNLVTGVEVDMVVNPVFGTINTPFGIQSTALIGFVGGEIEKDDFNGVKVGGLATSLDGGKLYFHVNPNDIDATGLRFSLVGGDGKEAPGYTLGAAVKADYNVTTIATRAAFNGYVADAGIIDGRAAQVTVPKDDLKKVAKNVLGKLRGQEALDITNAVYTIYNTFANAIPQYYALQTEYNTKDADGNIVKKCYTGKANIAAVTVKPLAFTTNIGVVGEKVNIPSIPAFEDLLGIEIKNIEFDDIIVNKITGMQFAATVPSANISAGVTPNAVGVFDDPVAKEVYIYLATNNIVTFKYSKRDNTSDANTYLYTMEGDVTAVIDEINTQLSKVESNVNTTLSSVKGALDKAGKYYNKVAPKLNKVISKVNYVLDNANQLLQPIMLGVADGEAFRLSEVEAAPTILEGNGENAVVLAPTSYTLELLAPAYKKSIKLNGTTQLNTAELDGNTKTVVASLKSGLNTIEYEVMDFYGNKVAKKYYIEVK